MGRQTLVEVDAGLGECDKIIRACSDAVKARLGGTGSIPPQLLRDLSRVNAQRGKLMMRRISLLTESGDSTALELIEKLMKVQPKAA